MFSGAWLSWLSSRRTTMEQRTLYNTLLTQHILIIKHPNFTPIMHRTASSIPQELSPSHPQAAANSHRQPMKRRLVVYHHTT